MSDPTTLEPRLYSVDVVAERLNIGRTLVFALIQHGQLDSVKIGRRRLVPHDDLVAYIERIKASR
jgi:excisionase family DNA binding protein